MYLQDHVLKGIAELKRHSTETTHTNNTTILPLILSKEVLEEVCCRGGVSKVGGVASAACEILGSLVILREELFWPELLESLLQWMPYIEVGTLPTVVYIIFVYQAVPVGIPKFLSCIHLSLHHHHHPFVALKLIGIHNFCHVGMHVHQQEYLPASPGTSWL